MTGHLAPASVMLLFGSCHLILGRVRQPLWEQVQENIGQMNLGIRLALFPRSLPTAVGEAALRER